MHGPADSPSLCTSMWRLTSGGRIWLSQRLPKAAKAEFREDTNEQTVGMALEDVEMAMKNSLLYIFRTARSSFKRIGGRGSCNGTGPEENEKHNRLGSLTSSYCRHPGNDASCQLLGRNQVLCLRGSITWARFMLRQDPSNLVSWTFFKQAFHVCVCHR